VPARKRTRAPHEAPGTPTAAPSRRAVAITLAVGLALLAAGVAAVLSQRGVHAAATNRVTASEALSTTAPPTRYCQRGEHVPAGTAAVRASLGSLSPTAPRIELLVRDASGVRARSSVSGARWSRHAVVVPLSRPLADEVDGRICIRLAPTAAHERVRLYGQAPDLSAEVEAGAVQAGRARFEYLYSGRMSWWAFGGTVVDRIGRGHVFSGRSVALAAALLALLSIALASWQLVRRDRRA
jgi:hypothetical protein